jgi:hypothetical protein
MTPWPKWENAGVVAGVRLAASTRPPRANSSFTPSIRLLAVATAYLTIHRSSNNRRASGESRLLRTPARCCKATMGYRENLQLLGGRQ